MVSHFPAQRLRILVVDDCRDAVESLRVLSTLWGHEVCTAYNGEEALETASTFQPHVVLLDIGLPKLNGYEVARKLRALPNADKIFLLATTGFGTKEDRRLTSQAGFDLHLTKPFDPQVLEDFLSKVVVGVSSCEGRIVCP